MTSQITSLMTVYSTVYSSADQRKHQSSASLAFVWGIHRSSVNSPHKGPVTQKMFPFDDVIISMQRHHHPEAVPQIKKTPTWSSTTAYALSHGTRRLACNAMTLLTNPPRHHGGKITDENFKRNFIHGNWLVKVLLNFIALQWRHNDRNGISNHQDLDCLLNHLFRHRSKKTSKLRVTGLCKENPPVTGRFPFYKGPVTRKMFSFDDVIMEVCSLVCDWWEFTIGIDNGLALTRLQAIL